MQPNFVNRTLWTGDNLHILRQLNSESVDLIYLDPPFNSNRTYEAPIGSVAAGAAFKDAWTLDDTDVAWHGEIAETSPRLYEIIRAGRAGGGDSMMAYLVMMAVRLIHMRRILKPTGSIYLHCDPTASHYLKLLMDVLFGRDKFRNEIVWKRSSRSDGHRFGWTHDTLLAYGGRGHPTWNDVYLDHDGDYIDRFYREKDERGRYKRDDLTGPGVTGGESGLPWRGTDPSKAGRCWSIPRRGAYAAWIESEIIPGYQRIPSVHGRLDALEKAGLIHWPKTGQGWPRLKRYLAASPGRRANDVFDDIRPVSNLSRERVGYPTQKPLALLERIIRASSNLNDVVLDPFCGCATALVAAERLGRQWVGIDLSPLAVKLVKQRLKQEMGMFYDIVARTDIPRRTDMGKLPNYRTHKHQLYGRQEGNCYGCKAHFPYKNLTIDHIVPTAHGGTDHLDNLQLLCGWCNSKKGTKSQESFLAEMAKTG